MHHTQGQEYCQDLPRRQAVQTFKAIGARERLGAVKASGASAHCWGVLEGVEDSLLTSNDADWLITCARTPGMSQSAFCDQLCRSKEREGIWPRVGTCIH